VRGVCGSADSPRHVLVLLRDVEDALVVDVAGLLLKEDDWCVAFGRVVDVSGRTTFEPPLFATQPYYRPGQAPTPRPSGLGVAVRGVDSTRLLDRREKDGASEGWVTLTGRWRKDELAVVDQRLERPVPPAYGQRWVFPPCPEPEQGWPVGEDVHVPAAYETLQASGAAVHATVFRPTARSAVLVVAAADPAMVTDELVPLLGDRVYVIASRYTRVEVDSVREEIMAHFAGWQAYSSGTTSDVQGQPVLTLDVVRVLPDLVDRARHWPPRLGDGERLACAWVNLRRQQEPSALCRLDRQRRPRESAVELGGGQPAHGPGLAIQARITSSQASSCAPAPSCARTAVTMWELQAA